MFAKAKEIIPLVVMFSLPGLFVITQTGGGGGFDFALWPYSFSLVLLIGSIFTPAWLDRVTSFCIPFHIGLCIPASILLSEQSLHINSSLMTAVGVCVLMLSVIFFVWTNTLFLTEGGGSLSPASPPSRFVVSGPYQHVRNPMILAVILFQLSLAFAVNESARMLLFTAHFFVMNNIYFIFEEEPTLSKRFGSSYDKYKRHVGRWMPRISPYKE